MSRQANRLQQTTLWNNRFLKIFFFFFFFFFTFNLSSSFGMQNKESGCLLVPKQWSLLPLPVAIFVEMYWWDHRTALYGVDRERLAADITIALALAIRKMYIGSGWKNAKNAIPKHQYQFHGAYRFVTGCSYAQRANGPGPRLPEHPTIPEDPRPHTLERTTYTPSHWALYDLVKFQGTWQRTNLDKK